VLRKAPYFYFFIIYFTHVLKKANLTNKIILIEKRKNEMKKQLILLTTILLATLSSCVGNTSSTSSIDSVTSSSEVSSESETSSSSSEEVLTPTTAITNDMLANLKIGYHAVVKKEISYDGEEDDNPRYYDAKVKDNVAYMHFYENYETGKLNSYYDFFITPVKESDGLTYAYQTGLGINNTLIYEPIEVTDSITKEDTNLLWEDAYLDNPFKEMDASYFSKVNDNEFKLDLSNTNVSSSDIELQLANQLFFDTFPYSTSLPDIYEFSLLTNGDKITGYSLEFESFTSSSSGVVTYKSSGKFLNQGNDVSITELTLLEGEEDADFTAAMTKLKTMNFKFDQVQYSYDYAGSNSFTKSLHYDGFSDGTSLVYYAYDLTSDSKIYAQALTPMTYEGMDGLGVYVPINGNYYSDSIFYTNYTNVKDYFSKFDFSSKFFTKQVSDGKTIFTLDRSRRIFRGNNIAMISPFDSDSYADLLVNLTITIENDKITFFNQTTDDDESGLRFKIEFSNFGTYSTLLTSDTIKEDCSDLKWSDLLSNDQVSLNAITKSLTQDNLDAIPTIGGIYANVRADVSSGGASPILYTYTYSQEANSELLTEYSQKLVDASFTKVSNNDGSDTKAETFYYTKQITIKSKTYLLKVAPATFWNSIQGWGQFQIAITVGSVK